MSRKILNTTQEPAFLNYKYFNIFLLPILLTLFTFLLYGVYFETNDDTIISLILKGDIQPHGGYYELSYFFYRYMVYFYSALYTAFPAVGWYGISLFLFNLIAVINLFYVLHVFLSGYFNRYIESAILVLIFFILIFENIAVINFTRTSIILSGSSLLAMSVYLTNKQHPGKIMVSLFCIMFGISMLIRPMAGLLTFFMLLPFIIYIGIKSKNTIFTFYFCGALLIFTLLLYSSTQFFRPAEEREIIEYGSKVANVVDFDYDIPVSLTTQRDSLKREAIKYFFVSDKQTISGGFLDTISSSHYISFSKFTFPRTRAAFIYTFLFLISDYPGCSLLYILVLIVILISLFKKNKFDFVFIFIIQIIFFLFLVLISILMKLPDRLLFPLYGIFIISNLFFLRYTDIKFILRNFALYSVAFIILSFGLSVRSISPRIGYIKNQNEENSKNFSILGAQFNNSTFIFTHPSSGMFTGIDALENLSLNNNKIFLLIGWTTILPSHRNELREICNSAELNDFINFIKNNSSFIIISDEKFNKFLSLYFRVIHNNELNFERLSSSPEVLKKRNLFLYYLTSP